MENSTKKKIAGVSVACVALIAAYEGFVGHTYKDPVGIPTIGYGHTGKDVKYGQKITKDEAKTLLQSDATKHWNEASKYIKVEVSQGERDAYTSFIYNVGVGSFKNSTLLKKLNQGKHSEACAELKKWVYAKGKKLPGLVKRRNAEYNMCMGGVNGS